MTNGICRTVLVVFIMAFSFQAIGREFNKDTGLPYYEADEAKPTDGTVYHKLPAVLPAVAQSDAIAQQIPAIVLQADASTRKAISEQIAEPLIQKTVVEQSNKTIVNQLNQKVRETDPQTGLGIYDPSETPPPGITYHIRGGIANNQLISESYSQPIETAKFVSYSPPVFSDHIVMR